MTRSAPLALTVVDALLLPGADAGPEWYFGWLQVGTDGRIVGIGPGDPPSDTYGTPVLDADGAMVAPASSPRTRTCSRPACAASPPTRPCTRGCAR